MMKHVLLFILLCCCASAWALDRGDKIPDDLGETWAEEALSASSLQGKTLVISFWATWCGPCRKEIPFLEGFQRQFGSDTLKVVTINHKEMRRDIKKLIPSVDKLQMVVARDVDGDVGDAFGVSSFPTLFIVNSEGVIHARHTGYSDASLMQSLNEAIKLSGGDKFIGEMLR